MTTQFFGQRNKDLFAKDPTEFDIPNTGVSKVGAPATPKQWEVLRYELTNFVCQGEYARGLDRILGSFLSHSGQAEQPAVWVSGFYGSGKSHLVRVLEQVWQNTTFPDGASARGVVDLPHDVQDQLVEVDAMGQRYGARPLAFAGTLDTQNVDRVNVAFLSIVLASAGLPAEVAPARFVLWLREEGLEDAVRTMVERSGRSFDREINNFGISRPVADAVLAERPDLGPDPATFRDLLKRQFPAEGELTTGAFLTLLRQLLEGLGGGVVPPTLIVLDELQQFINSDPSRLRAVQSLVEAVTSRMDGRVLLVATGQSEMTADEELNKIQDRFAVRVSLQNQDVDAVVRQVLLRKKDEYVVPLRSVLDANSAEIRRQLAGSSLAHRDADDEHLVPDYPLLPARRVFWERVLRAVDTGGRAGQLRSQLRVVHDANRAVADQTVGTVVGADFIYQQKHDDMQQYGRLLKETQLTIAEQGRKSASDDGPLRERLLQVIHLISLLPAAGAGDAGIRATPEHLADLLVRDLATDGVVLRERVPEVLARLAAEGVVQQEGREFRLQTVTGREWDQDFKGRQARFVGDAGGLAHLREELLRAELARWLPQRVLQGSTGVPRKLMIEHGDHPPAGSDIAVWIRSGWNGVTEKQFVDTARGAGQDAPLVLVRVPSQNREELRTAIAEWAAARDVVDAKAVPTTDEGREAQRAMSSRRDRARAEVDRLVRAQVQNSSVLVAGGSEVNGASLTDRVHAAASRVTDRAYPEFDVADDKRWAVVVTRLGEGAGDAVLEVLGHQGSPTDHPVVKAVLARIGSTPTPGTELMKHFQARPYGWGLDSLRGAIGVLVASGEVTAYVNGAPSQAADVLKLATRWGPLRVRRDSTSVTTVQLIKVRGLLKILGVEVVGNALDAAVRQAVGELRRRAEALSGPSPLPERDFPEVVRVAGETSGNASLLAFLEADAEIRRLHTLLVEQEDRAGVRRERLDLARRLATAAEGVPAAGAAVADLRAFEAGRSLLVATDGITPVVQALADVLRGEVQAAALALEESRARAVASLADDSTWADLDGPARTKLLDRHRLGERGAPAVADSASIADSLSRTPLTAWWAERDAVPGRVATLRGELAARRTPTAVGVSLPGRTIESDAELDAYVDAIRDRLRQALTEHGSLVVRGS